MFIDFVVGVDFGGEFFDYGVHVGVFDLVGEVVGFYLEAGAWIFVVY